MNAFIQSKRKPLGTLLIALAIGIVSGMWLAVQAADVQSAKKAQADESVPGTGLHVWF